MKMGRFVCKSVTLGWDEPAELGDTWCSITVTSYWHESMSITSIISEIAAARGIPEGRITSCAVEDRSSEIIRQEVKEAA